MDFIAFTVHILNDRTQTLNWISPGAALSGFSRYTQQHLFLCPWKWDCLWARECLCITFFSCVYSMENDDSKISNKNYFKLILVTLPVRTNFTNRKFHWLWTWKHLSTDSSQVYVFRRQRKNGCLCIYGCFTCNEYSNETYPEVWNVQIWDWTLCSTLVESLKTSCNCHVIDFWIYLRNLYITKTLE